MIPKAGPPLPWGTVAWALLASVFASVFALGNLAHGQDTPGRGAPSRMQDGQRDPQRSRRPSSYRSLKVGQYAPTFTLASPDGKETFDLRDSCGKRPVVLIFGSYT